MFDMKKNIEHYLHQLLPLESEQIGQLKKVATETAIPIMEETALNFLLVLIHLKSPKRILEIGTGIGYSAIRMAEVCPKSKIITIEKDEKRFTKALNNIKKYDKCEQIQVIHQDALHYLTNYHGEKFDFVFIDAAKSKYKQFFQLADQWTDHSASIITDNVLFRGYVINSTSTPQRYKRLVNNLRNFNEWLAKHPDYLTTIVPIGDGVAISVKH